jgi:hypothetical protein
MDDSLHMSEPNIKDDAEDSKEGSLGKDGNDSVSSEQKEIEDKANNSNVSNDYGKLSEVMFTSCNTMSIYY